MKANQLANGTVEKDDSFIQTYMGTTYKIEQPPTVGELKAQLRAILDDLPEDDALEISEVWFNRNEVCVTLKTGIVQ